MRGQSSGQLPIFSVLIRFDLDQDITLDSHEKGVLISLDLDRDTTLDDTHEKVACQPDVRPGMLLVVVADLMKASGSAERIFDLMEADR